MTRNTDPATGRVLSVRVTLRESDLYVVDAALRFYVDNMADDLDPAEDQDVWIENAQAARGRLIRARHRIGLRFPEDPPTP